MDIHLDAKATEGHFTSKDGLNIVYRSWSPAGAARGVLVIVPGFNSHSGYYGWVAGSLAANGLSVFAVDLRGRGKSDGERFYVDAFADYANDVAGVMAIAITANPGLPIYLLGHSAGGVVACIYTLDHQDQLAGLICESFAFQVPAPDFAIAALKGLSHLAPHAHVLKLANKDFSRDPAAVAAMDADPLITHETQPTKTVAEMARARRTSHHAGGLAIDFLKTFVVNAVDAQSTLLHHAALFAVLARSVGTGPGTQLAADALVLIDQHDAVLGTLVARAGRADGDAFRCLAVQTGAREMHGHRGRRET